MPVTHQIKGDEMIIRYIGELGHHEALGAMEYMENVLDLYTPQKLTLDLSAMTFMDSSGIAVIMCAYRNTKDFGCELALKNVPVQAMKIIRAAGINRTVKIIGEEIHHAENCK